MSILNSRAKPAKPWATAKTCEARDADCVGGGPASTSFPLNDGFEGRQIPCEVNTQHIGREYPVTTVIVMIISALLVFAVVLGVRARRARKDR